MGEHDVETGPKNVLIESAGATAELAPGACCNRGTAEEDGSRDLKRLHKI